MRGCLEDCFFQKRKEDCFFQGSVLPSLSTSAPPSFLKYTDHVISGELLRPEDLEAQLKFETLVARVACLEREKLFRLTVTFIKMLLRICCVKAMHPERENFPSKMALSH